jgi:hypothetical protein
MSHAGGVYELCRVANGDRHRGGTAATVSGPRSHTVSGRRINDACRIEGEHWVNTHDSDRTRVSKEQKAYGRCRCGAKTAPHLGPRTDRAAHKRPHALFSELDLGPQHRRTQRFFSGCPTVSLSHCPTVQLSNWQNANTDGPQGHRAHRDFFRLSSCPTVQLSNCPTAQLAKREHGQGTGAQTTQRFFRLSNA